MKSDHLKESKNIEDRRGQSGGSYSSGRSGGNLGGGILQILLSPGSLRWLSTSSQGIRESFGPYSCSSAFPCQELELGLEPSPPLF